MKRSLTSSDASDITAEACAWIAQLETAELTSADLDAFREWIGRSPRHAAEIKQLAAMSKDLNVMSGMAEPMRDAASGHRAHMKTEEKPGAFGFGRVARFAMAVCVVVVAALIFQRGVSPEPPMLITTAVGEYQEFKLSDDSVVKLNTNSQIEISYEKHARKVRLLSGEVFFEVTPNAERPFFVYAGSKFVRVVGTAFLVSLIEAEFDLMVTKGKVQLEKTATIAATQQMPGAQQDQPEELGQDFRENPVKQASAPISLVAGQRITLADKEDSAPIVSVSKRAQQRALSWQDSLHDFSNTRLEDVVAELSRHSSMSIEITDPALRNLEFGGIFRIGDTEALFGALETSFGIQVSYLEDNRVILSKR